MTFGDDLNTRIFRIFVAFMIRYKIYAENQQKEGKNIDPQVERFLKIDQSKLRYRQSLSLFDIDMKNKVT
jgi:hypothetical protein